MPQSPSDDFLWVGASGGAWNTAADWNDLTTATNPSAIPPGAGSTDEIDGGSGLTVAGAGLAAALTATGTVTLTGPLTAGVLALSGANAALTIEAAATAGALSGIGNGDSVVVTNGLASLTFTAAVAIGVGLTAENNDAIYLPSGASLNGGTLDASTSGNPLILIGGPVSGNSGGGAVVVASGATLSGAGAIYAGYGLVEVGAYAEGSVTGTTEVDGVLQASGIADFSFLAGTGDIEVLPGGSFSSQIGLASGAALNFTVDADGQLYLPESIAAGSTIALNGPGATLVFNSAYGLGEGTAGPAAVNVPVNGVAAGDRFAFTVFSAAGVDQVTLTALGQLEVLNPLGGVEEYLNVGAAAGPGFLLTPTALNFNGNFDGFLAPGVNQGETQIDVLADTAYSAGSGAGTFVWSGTASGAWGDAANWLAGGAPASVAPGNAANVTIDGAGGIVATVLTQAGSGNTVTINNNVAFAGAFDIGLLAVAASGFVQAGVGATLEVGALTVGVSAEAAAYGNDQNAPGGFFDVRGTTDIGVDGTLFAAYGGRLQTAILLLSGGDSVSVNDNGDIIQAGSAVASANASAITIGTLNDAEAGSLRIDAGGTIDDRGGNFAAVTVSGSIENDGLYIATDSLLYGAESGSGTFEVAAGGTLSIGNGGPDPGSTLAYLLGAGSDLSVTAAAYGTGETFDFAGAGAVLNLNAYGTIETRSILSTITGFALGDEITIGNAVGQPAIAGTAYTQTGAGLGTLTLLGDGGAAVGSLAFAGDYTGANFVVSQLDGVTVALAEQGHSGLSAGTGGADDYLFQGPVGGAWGDPANWQDTTQGQNPASVAPGANDTVIVNGPTAGTGLLTGTGDAATLTPGGYMSLSGSFDVGALSTGAFATPFGLAVDAGSTLTVGAATLPAFRFYLAADGIGAVLAITGTLSGGVSFEYGNSINALDGGRVEVDAIGSLVNAYFIAGNDGTVDLPGTASSGQSLEFQGSGGVYALGSPTTAAIAPAGVDYFTAGNTLDITLADPIASVSSDITGYYGGTITLYDAAHTQIGALAIGGSGYVAGETFTATPISANTTAITLNAACYAAGTRIATETGDMAVEALRPGDRVRSALGGVVPVVWAGRRRVDCRRHPDPAKVWPVRVRRDAFGPGLPVRDLYLSRDHAVYVQGVLIPIGSLINGVTVLQEAVDAVTYWHVELPFHGIILAEGLPAESYLDTGNRAAFADGGQVLRPHPEFAAGIREARTMSHLVAAGPILDQVRRSLRARARVAIGAAEPARLRRAAARVDARAAAD